MNKYDTANLSNKNLSRLTPRNERIVRLYYGLSGQPSMTIGQIASIEGVTPSRVGQLLRKSLDMIL